MLTPKEKADKERKETITICSIAAIGYVFIILLIGHINALIEKNPRLGLLNAANIAFSDIFQHPTNIVFKEKSASLFWGLTILYFIIIFLYIENRKISSLNKGKKLADGHLMTPQELKEYNKECTEPFGKSYVDETKCAIISQDIFLSFNNAITNINQNLLALGKSGGGKSYNLVAPNILQFNCNLVITDPSEELLHKYAKALENVGYEIMVFNTSDMSRSLCYNPFHYIRREKDVFTIVNTLIKNTTKEGSSGDDFWPKAEALLLKALMLLLWHVYDESEQTFENILKLIDLITTDQSEAQTESILDVMFKDLEIDDPGNLACGQYKKFKKAADKTLQSILISLSSRIESFMLSDIRYLTSKDEMHFETFADSKKALFIIIPNEGGDFNWIVSMMYTQLFSELYKYSESRSQYGYLIKNSNDEIIKVFQAKNKNDSKNAKKKAYRFAKAVKEKTFVKYNKKKQLYYLYTIISNKKEIVTWKHRKEDLTKYRESLNKINVISCEKGLPNDGRCCPHHVKMILDEFANIGQIPAFEQKLAVIRKYEISCMIILQTLSQLQTLYDKNKWNTIIGNCDTDLLLGTRDPETVKWFKEYIGEEEIEVENQNMGNSKNPGSKSRNKQKTEVMSSFKIYTMSKKKCLVAVAGYPVHYGYKYDTRKHRNWSYVEESKGQFEIKPTSENINIIPFRLRVKKENIHKNAVMAEQSLEPSLAIIGDSSKTQLVIKEKEESIVEVGYISDMVINYSKTE